MALELARPLVHGRTIVLTASAAGSCRMARFFADAGAHVVQIDLGLAERETRTRFTAYQRALARPTEQLRTRLDTEDPHGSALVYAGSFTAAASLCARRVIGARSIRHLNAERKDTQRELFGIRGHVACLDDGLEHVNLPAVVQGIPDHGIAMATSHTYLLPGTADIRRVRELTATLKRDCTQVVTNRFDPGIPCTFYGFITAKSIIDVGPVEALVSWDPRTLRLHANGILRPLLTPEHVLRSARVAVHAIAQRLHNQLGYVGAFGVDGVLTGEGYAIHEINPRVCAGFNLLDQLAPQAAPLAAIDLVLRELPDMSTVLDPPLAALATALQRHPTPAYRLWETPAHSVPAPATSAARLRWSEQIRTTAARGRRPVNELKEMDL